MPKIRLEHKTCTPSKRRKGRSPYLSDHFGLSARKHNKTHAQKKRHSPRLDKCGKNHEYTNRSDPRTANGHKTNSPKKTKQTHKRSATNIYRNKLYQNPNGH